jgi:hypothetical protein
MVHLAELHGPEDLKDLSHAEARALCGELRGTIIETVAQTGGHLGSSLGVVELTVALHRVLSSPSDRIVWDTGHQAYAHKLLTGRYERFGTLRQLVGWVDSRAAARASTTSWTAATPGPASPSPRAWRSRATYGVARSTSPSWWAMPRS